MYCTKGLVTLTLLLFTHSTFALVMDYDLGKARIYEQTANDTAPTLPANFAFFSQLSTDNSNDFSSVDLSGATAGIVPFAEENGGFSWDIFEEFGDETNLNSAFPDGDYKIEATTPIGVIREEVTLDGSFPATIPYFTGGVADALQSIDPAQSTMLSWNAPVSTVNTIVFVEDALTGNEILYIEPATGVTSTTIPADSFQAGGQYIAGVIFLNDPEDQRESFSTGTGSTIKGNITEIPFNVAVVPEPASVATVGFALSLIWLRTTNRRRSSLARS